MKISLRIFPAVVAGFICFMFVPVCAFAAATAIPGVAPVQLSEAQNSAGTLEEAEKAVDSLVDTKNAVAKIANSPAKSPAHTLDIPVDTDHTKVAQISYNWNGFKVTQYTVTNDKGIVERKDWFFYQNVDGKKTVRLHKLQWFESGSGLFDSSWTEHFNTAGHLTKRESFDSLMRRNNTWTYNTKNGLETKHIWFGYSDNTRSAYVNIKRNLYPDGKVKWHANLNPQGAVLSKQLYFYESNGQLTRIDTYGKKGSRIQKAEYYNVAGVITRTVNY